MGTDTRSMAAPKIVFSAATLAVIEGASESPPVTAKPGNCTLIASSDESFAHDLATAICGAGSKDLCWSVSNKYYSAQVAMQPASLDDLTTRAPAAQAVLLLFERGDTASFKLAAAAWDRHAAREEFEEPGALLVVPVYRPGGSSNEMDEDSLTEWAINNYGEVIDAIDLSKDPAIEQSDDDGCKIGLGRVREALQVVSWPCYGEPLPRVNPEARPLAQQQAEAEHPTAEGLTEASAMCNIMEGAGMPPNAPLDEGDDVEKAFAKVAQARLAAGSLPDDERRRCAADAALELMKSLGFDDEDCSSESDDGEGLRE